MWAASVSETKAIYNQSGIMSDVYQSGACFSLFLLTSYKEKDRDSLQKIYKKFLYITFWIISNWEFYLVCNSIIDSHYLFILFMSCAVFFIFPFIILNIAQWVIWCRNSWSIFHNFFLTIFSAALFSTLLNQ